MSRRLKRWTAMMWSTSTAPPGGVLRLPVLAASCGKPARRAASRWCACTGVPASSFLYRKVLRELAARGLRGVAVDLPGLGLADRPAAFDYTWTGLGRFCAAAVDALGLGRFHLVVHDIGGPVGFALASAMPGRVASLTGLDTLVGVDTFKRPWPMEALARPGLRR